MTKFCKDCRYLWNPIMPSMHGPYTQCMRPLSEEISLVDGRKVRTADTSPSSERKAGRTWFGLGRERCGPEAKFFCELPKRPPPPPPSRAKPKK